jgi:hypothetical protein
MNEVGHLNRVWIQDALMSGDFRRVSAPIRTCSRRGLTLKFFLWFLQLTFGCTIWD